MISNQRKKKIAYITGTRADFGLMLPIVRAINKSPHLDLEVYVTGIHLMKEFGLTVREVKKEFPRAKEIKVTFDGDNYKSTAIFLGKFTQKITEVLSRSKPDLVLVQGDRSEMLAVALVCLYLRIPIAHTHGGEKTGTVDEVARHAITKLAHLHFPATKNSAERIIKMGEEKNRVYIVGAPALDVILNEKLPSKEELFKYLNIPSDKKIILLTLHPVSEDSKSAGRYMKTVLAAVKSFGMHVVVVSPHADAGGRKIIKEINKEKNNPLFRIFPNMSHKIFLALEREAEVWVGNSSGAIIESTSFGLPVVNIGERQKNRDRSGNILDVEYDKKAIIAAIHKSLFDKKYRAKVKKLKNLWGDGKAAPRVLLVLEKLKITSELLNKYTTY